MHKQMKVKILALLIILLSLATVTYAASSWIGTVSNIDSLLKQALQVYQTGDKIQAKGLVDEAYFGSFEGDRMEQAVRSDISAQRASEIEFQFQEIKKDIDSGQDAPKVKKEEDILLSMLRNDAGVLQKAKEGSGGLWFYSFMIIVREGVEAILVIAAIVAYLIKSGNSEKVKGVYQSAFVAVLFSVITAYVFKTLFPIASTGKAQEAMEGIILLVATIILAFMSYWMFSHADPRRWKNYIQGKVEDSLSNGKKWTLLFAAFLAVYREGAETVLFYQALFAETTDGSDKIWTGLIAGSLLLVLLFYLIRYSSTKLPLKPFFQVSGALLFLLAFVFAGNGMNEMQIGGWFGSTAITGVQAVASLGIYPTWEGISVQTALLLLAIIGLVIGKRKIMIQNKNTKGVERL